MSKIEKYILMNPSDGLYTSNGMMLAMWILGKKYNVKFEPDPFDITNHGFGLEKRYIISGNKSDIDFVLENFYEWARDFSDPEEEAEK